MVALNLVKEANKRRQMPDQVSELTTNRLSVYLRCLNTLDETGVQTISSQALAERFHLNAAQIRKDLAYFGEFGVRGVGYYVKELRRHLRKILGLDRQLRVAIMGAGNLGLALADYPGFRQEGFEIAALFDAADEKIGHESRSGVPIHDIKELRRVARKDRLDILPLVTNELSTSPAAGRGAVALSPAIERLRSDLVMGLAVVHHMVAAERIRIKRLTEIFAAVTNRWLLLEFVPPLHPKIGASPVPGLDDFTAGDLQDSLKTNFASVRSFASYPHDRQLFVCEK